MSIEAASPRQEPPASSARSVRRTAHRDINARQFETRLKARTKMQQPQLPNARDITPWCWSF